MRRQDFTVNAPYLGCYLYGVLLLLPLRVSIMRIAHGMITANDPVQNAGILHTWPADSVASLPFEPQY